MLPIMEGFTVHRELMVLQWKKISVFMYAMKGLMYMVTLLEIARVMGLGLVLILLVKEV